MFNIICIKLSERLKVFVATDSLFKEKLEKHIKYDKISFIIIFDKLQFHSIEIDMIQLDTIDLDLVEDVDMNDPNLKDYSLLYLHYCIYEDHDHHQMSAHKPSYN